MNYDGCNSAGQTVNAWELEGGTCREWVFFIGDIQAGSCHELGAWPRESFLDWILGF